MRTFSLVVWLVFGTLQDYLIAEKHVPNQCLLVCARNLTQQQLTFVGNQQKSNPVVDGWQKSVCFFHMGGIERVFGLSMFANGFSTFKSA